MMKLSVVIPAYNAANRISLTLDSVLAATDVVKEVIVVDDGSTDDLPAALAPYLASGLVRMVRQKNSGGPASPRNRGVAEARGQYVLFLDADDIIISHEVKPAVDLMDLHPDVSMICGNFHITDPSLNVVVPRALDRFANLAHVLRQKVSEDAWLLPSDEAVSALVQRNFVGTSSVIARRTELIRVGPFDESLRHLDDRDMWIRLAMSSPIMYRRRVFYNYRDFPDSISKKRELRQFRERVVVAEKTIKALSNPETRQFAHRWRCECMLKIGNILFDEHSKKRSALVAFSTAFWACPSGGAVRGCIKTLLPERLYKWAIRLRESFN